jgi:hypothetical protein
MGTSILGYTRIATYNKQLLPAECPHLVRALQSNSDGLLCELVGKERLVVVPVDGFRLLVQTELDNLSHKKHPAPIRG